MTTLSDDDLLALRLLPARLGPLVTERRRALLGDAAATIAIEPAAPLPARTPALLVRDAALVPLSTWPAPDTWKLGDCVVIHVPDADDARRAFVTWLRGVAARAPEASVAPIGPDAAGLHKLWCIAAARLLLPASMRVQVRHDGVGIRLTQIALGMGADVLAGPIEPDRTLPLAGVTRPTETTREGLRTLVRQAGLRPRGPAEDPMPAVAASSHIPEARP